jgi:hypothetical protein
MACRTAGTMSRSPEITTSVVVREGYRGDAG